MNTSLVRSEMLKCGDNCRVGIMIGGGIASLMWHAGSNWHEEKLKISDCAIGKVEFAQAMDMARIGLIY